MIDFFRFGYRKRLGDTPIHPFAFRTHTHGMGRVVSAFYKNATAWTLIGKRNPQWPQLFEPIGANLTISNGDLMAATCVFDSSMQKTVVHMGNTGADEMCNFYMMFYWDATAPDPFPYGAVCGMQEEQAVVNKEYPIDGVTLLPPHPDWEHKAHQSGKPFGVTEGSVTTSIGGIKLGQVSALSFDSFGNLVVFHRADRLWDDSSFDAENILHEQTAIADDVILVTQTNGPNRTMSLLSKHGSGKFFMPHGLTIDQQNDYYTTDVGSHQVIKFFMPHGLTIDQQNDYYTTDVGSHQVIKWTLSQGSLAEVFVLGEKFVPGSDQQHFCKPAGVAVTVDGNIYVADGYCNNRIVKFDRNGKFLAQWGQPNYGMSGLEVQSLGSFSLPHDIVANDDGSLLYIADRENARIQIFRSTGQPVGQIVNPANSTAFWNVYSAHYHIYFIPGEPRNGVRVRAFSAHAEAARVQYSFEPTSYQFLRPHTLRASADGRYIYVGELGQNGGRILQFIIHRDSEEAGQDTAGLASLHTHLNYAENSSFPLMLIVLLTLIALPCLVVYIYRRKRLIRLGKQQSVLDRAGFKPLRTDDPESTDDESEDDTIIARQKSDHRF
ncbi:unnamed protein product [Gongylonema pulchrum]|uniref:peptidylamidoglycolate lyase n=1 Tax=Gongylonema pulchrum TaxID=637853 RepID=A0A183DQ75_9BILA|nr:unnamed protein product [Gongylonema pulchrum]